MRRHLAALLVVFATACGSDSPVAPNTSTGPNNTGATLDQALTELTLPVLSAVDGTIPSVPALGTGRCTYTAASQSFVCVPVTSGGVTVEQSFTLLTASAVKQSAFDPGTTASVKTNTIVAGTVIEDGSKLTLNSQQELTLSGLLVGPRMLNGATTAHLFGVLGDAPLDINIKGSFSNIVLPANIIAGAQVYPVSGTIVAESSGSFAGLPPFTSRLTMTFNGTSKVPVTITEDGVSQTCQHDLSKGVAPSCG